jgi:hypothetical protein
MGKNDPQAPSENLDSMFEEKKLKIRAESPLIKAM